jgi:hypothetical protein
MQHFFLANAKSDAEGEKGFSTKESMNGKDRLQVCFTAALLKHQHCFTKAKTAVRSARGLGPRGMLQI